MPRPPAQPAPATPEAVHQRALGLLTQAAGAELPRVLDGVLRAAAQLAAARYGALGVPDGRGGFARFHTVGVSDGLARQIGELPRTHGVLGVLLEKRRPLLLDDITTHPRFGWFPRHHPPMKDFLGVPLVHQRQVVGNLFLSGSRRGAFTRADLTAVTQLGAVAAIAVANASLTARAQELAVLEERNRMARELHDAASQTLFSLVYEAHAAALQARDPDSATALRRIEERASDALAELRALVHALRPRALGTDSLGDALVAHAQAVQRLHGVDVVIDAEADLELDPEVEHALLRIAQEALHNAVRHAAGAPVRIRLARDAGAVALSVRDQGPGFDPGRLSATTRHYGMASMRERAAAVGAEVTIDSAPGRGTDVRVRVPLRGG